MLALPGCRATARSQGNLHVDVGILRLGTQPTRWTGNGKTSVRNASLS